MSLYERIPVEMRNRITDLADDLAEMFPDATVMMSIDLWRDGPEAEGSEFVTIESVDQVRKRVEDSAIITQNILERLARNGRPG